VSDRTAEIKARFEACFDVDAVASIDEICAEAARSSTDIAELLRWLQQDAVAEPQTLTLATRRLRRALGLPMIPGAVCRPAPKT
jgi:hypothetical protein